MLTEVDELATTVSCALRSVFREMVYSARVGYCFSPYPNIFHPFFLDVISWEGDFFSHEVNLEFCKMEYVKYGSFDFLSCLFTERISISA